MDDKAQGAPQGPDVKSMLRIAKLASGPLLAIMVYLLLGPSAEALASDGLAPNGAMREGALRTAAVLAWMAAWWLTEAVPLPVTSLLPLVLLPATGVTTFGESASPYAGRVIYLFLGGFLLAIGMERWNLHRRIALVTVLMVGTSPARLIGGFMLATAVMSMWMSNTATTIMLVPIGLSVIHLVADRTGRYPTNFAVCMLLGIAYASSIGGVATPIGTPPNTFLLQFLANHGKQISFLQWMGVGLPVVIVFLPLTWLLLTKVLYRSRIKSIPGGRDLIRDELAKLGPVKRAEWTVMSCFGLAVLMWLLRGILSGWTPDNESLKWIPHFFAKRIDDSSIAIAAAMLLFVIPVDLKQNVFTLSWEDAQKIPWGILLLFGGGLSLAKAAEVSGLSVWIGEQVSAFSDLPTWLFVLMVATIIIFLTEVTSNTATASIFFPILFGVAATGLGIDPLLLLVPAAIGASCAFMMPVATPPNAIVFGSGHLKISQMAKAGFGLNLISIMLVTVATYTVVLWVLGATTSGVPDWARPKETTTGPQDVLVAPVTEEPMLVRGPLIRLTTAD